jgi:hypothetical protein
MNEFENRINDIYPPAIYSFVTITVLAIVVEVLFYNPEKFFNFGSILGFLIWLFVALESIDAFVIRKRIFTKAKTNKKELIAYLEHRAVKERRKVRLFRKKDKKPVQDVIKEMILELKKDKLKLRS